MSHRKHRFASITALALSAALLLAGCSSSGSGGSGGGGADAEPLAPLSELDVVSDPRTYEGPSTALLPDSAITPVAEHPEQTLPSTVTSYNSDGTEEQVTIEKTDKVVSVDLSGSIAAGIWGLGFGDTLVGVDQAVTFPGTEDIPKVTSGGHTVNAESIIELKPDIVITDGTVGPRDVIEQLSDVGVKVVFVKNEASYQGAQNLVRELAAVYGAPEVGEQLADRIGTEVEEKIAEIAEIAPSDPADKVRMVFLYLRGNAGIYYLFGEESGADELIDGLGGVDVAEELGWDGMKPMTDEALIAANPDLILVMTKGIESAGGIDGLLEDKPSIAVTAAGEHRRFVDMEDGAILSFGPRSASILDALARAVYAPESVASAE